nr:Zeaxanthin epoxidase [Ipomoea batatas]
MELTTTTQSLSHAKIPKLFSNGGTFFAQNSVNFLGYNCLPRNLQCSAKHLRSLGAIHASEGQNTSTAVSIKWLLEPVGDGDTKHIGYPTAMPGAFEISSGAVTVGRVSDKADMVIPVPTVSGAHARLRHTEDCLVVTDLDSTNGTFIDEKRLRPGVAAAALPGTRITFGDTHLAIFRVSKLEKVDDAPEEQEDSAEAS